MNLKYMYISFYASFTKHFFTKRAVQDFWIESTWSVYWFWVIFSLHNNIGKVDRVYGTFLLYNWWVHVTQKLVRCSLILLNHWEDQKNRFYMMGYTVCHSHIILLIHNNTRHFQMQAIICLMQAIIWCNTEVISSYNVEGQLLNTKVKMD